MAFQQSARQNIQLRVNDLVRGDTKVGQVAVVIGQGWTQVPAGRQLPDGTLSDGSVAATISLELQLYSLNGSELGETLTADPRFVTLTPTLDGKNDTLVDATTGQILGVRAQYPDKADWGAFCRSFSDRDTLLQGDYFEQRRTHEVVTEDEIIYHLRAASALGRFA